MQNTSIRRSAALATAAALAGRRPRCRERGAAAVEYALIVTLIAVAIVVSLALFGENVLGLFQRGSDCLGTPSSC